MTDAVDTSARAVRARAGVVVPAAPISPAHSRGPRPGRGAGPTGLAISGPDRAVGLWRDPGVCARVGGTEEGWCVMGAQSDQVKGRAKEAAGILTGDDDLEAEGKADRLAGEAEEKIDHAKDKAEEVLDKVKDKVDEAVDKTKDALGRA